MNNRLSISFIGSIVISIVFFSCATGYKSIKPSKLVYPASMSNNNIEIDYEKNILQGKYFENERKTGTALLALKIINNSPTDFNVNTDLKIFAGEKELTLLRLNSFYELTRQNANKSLLFLLLIPANAYSSSQTTDGDQVTSSKFHFYPVGLVLGPLLAFTNKGRANAANHKFQRDLEDNDLSGKVVHPGETAYGFIAINASAMQPLSIKSIR